MGEILAALFVTATQHPVADSYRSAHSHWL